jgi:hypothetical protein
MGAAGACPVGDDVETIVWTHTGAAHDAAYERTLEITLLEPGAQAYVFTFG